MAFSSQTHRPSFQWKKAERAATSQACTSAASSSLCRRVCALYTVDRCVSEVRTVAAVWPTVFRPPPREELNQLLRSGLFFIPFSPRSFIRDVASKQSGVFTAKRRARLGTVVGAIGSAVSTVYSSVCTCVDWLQLSGQMPFWQSERVNGVYERGILNAFTCWEIGGYTRD